MAAARTLKVDSPHMTGVDVKGWQQTIANRFRTWGIDYPVVVDGDYGVATRAAGSELLYSMGLSRGLMDHGVTPELRIKVRRNRRSPAELVRFAARKSHRARLRAKHAGGGVALPVSKIITDSWGYHPPGHDGVDVICAANAPLYAMVRSEVIDVRAGGWWGKAPSGTTSLGDGIIQLEVLEDVGPFRRGQHIGYGHAEKATVKVGDVVKAGEQIGHAGLAVAWHIHLMVNTGHTDKGVGNLDPRPFLNYCKANA